MSSPPKPWERAGAGAPVPSSAASAGATGNGGAAVAPSRPPRPGMNGGQFGVGHSGGGYHGGGYGGGGHGGGYGGLGGGGYGGMSGYGGIGGGLGGYGGMGGGLGGYSGGMGGHGGYSGLSGYGSPFGGYSHNPMMQQQGQLPGSEFARKAEESTQTAFQSLAAVVQAFSAVALMLDSTFYAVYNSFRAVLGVAVHFSQLRAQLVESLSSNFVTQMVRRLLAMLRRILVWLRLRQPDVNETVWEAVGGSSAVAAANSAQQNKPGSWPILVFLAVALGAPWLIWTLLRGATRGDVGAASSSDWLHGSGPHYVGQVLFDFEPQSSDELPARAGDQLFIAPQSVQPHVRGWLLAGLNGKQGLIPMDYVKLQHSVTESSATISANGTASPLPLPSSAGPPPSDGAFSSTPSTTSTATLPALSPPVTRPTAGQATSGVTTTAHGGGSMSGDLAPGAHSLHTGNTSPGAGSRYRSIAATTTTTATVGPAVSANAITPAHGTLSNLVPLSTASSIPSSNIAAATEPGNRPGDGGGRFSPPSAADPPMASCPVSVTMTAAPAAATANSNPVLSVASSLSPSSSGHLPPSAHPIAPVTKSGDGDCTSTGNDMP